MRINIPSQEWLTNPEIFRINREDTHSDHSFTLYGRESRQYLNGEWKFSYSERPADRNTKMFSKDYRIQNLANIQVPGHIQLQGYGNPQYVNIMYPWDGNYEVKAPAVPMEVNPVGSYVKDVVIDKALMKGSRQYISFQGVESAFYLYVNGKFVGYSEDSFTPSEFDITDFITEGINRIGVEVYKWSSASWLEDQDFFRFSGIFRDVYIYAVPKVHIRDIFVHTNVADNYKEACINIDVDIRKEAEVCTGINHENTGKPVYTGINYENAGKPAYTGINSGNENTSGTAAYKKELTYSLTVKDMDGNEVVKMSDCTEEELFGVDIPLKAVKLWSAENPYLYTLTINVCEEGTELEELELKVGIRRFEIKDKLMLINGRRIEFNGINRHEFDCRRGRCVTEADMLWDIRFLKQHNINAVRTSHYPNCTRWYELCDEYGIYMIDETNLETHGTWLYGVDSSDIAIPGDKPEWLGAVLDRVQSMVHRDKNHPAVIIWSCGNESYGGKNIYEMSKLMKELDSSRIVHYEGIFHDRRYPDTSDVESRMYEKVWNIEEYLNNNPPKPFIGCEYMHAMGNSCGGIKEYTDLLDKYPMYQGSFIWDYIDQSLYQKLDDGSERLAYGGDFDEVPDDGNFCGDGIVFADRTVSPKAQEVKFVYQPVIIEPDFNGIKIKNKRLFTDTSDMLLEISLLRDGRVIRREVIEAVVEPLGEGYFTTGMTEYLDEPGEYFVQAAYVLKNAAKWAEAGYELMSGRSSACVIPDKAENVQVMSEASEAGCEKESVRAGKTLCTFASNGITVVHGRENLGIHGSNIRDAGNEKSSLTAFDMTFSAKYGGLFSIKRRGKEILYRRPEFCFYRAATDNDRGCRYMSDSGIWKFVQHSQRCISYEVKSESCCEGEALKIHCVYELPVADGGYIIVNDKREAGSALPDKSSHRQGIRAEVTYTVTPDGVIHTEIIYHGAKGLPELPLFGMEFALKKEFDSFEYYGIGPGENYCDRNNGGKIGIFTSTVVENYSPYLKPQTCGNRTETRWVSFTDGAHRITFKAGKNRSPFQFTALHYNETELENAPHKEELPKPYCTYVKIMPVQMGVGGDDSWGAQVREYHRVSSEEDIRYEFDIITE